MPSKTLIETFARTAVIIDDSRAEVEGLIKKLDSIGILNYFGSLDQSNGRIGTISPQIIFLDLQLNPSKSTVENISVIRKLLEDNFPKDESEPYGIVLWTKHIDELEDFRQRISKDRKKELYTTPIFIVGLPKKNYQEHGYSNILQDLDKVIMDDKAAYFFIKWMVSVRKAAGAALSGIYSLVGDYEKQNTELLYLLSILAQNHTGAPANKLEKAQGHNLTIDAFKAFDELLYADLVNALAADDMNLFGFPLPTNPWENDFQHELDTYAKLNAKAFIDEINIDQALVIPGNVYEIPRDVIPKTCGVPKAARTIMIELTPPCDFSNKKNVFSRCVCGFMWDCNVEQNHLAERLENFEAGYRYLLWPIHFDDCNYMLCFDFRCLISCLEEDITKGDQYKVLFKVNPRLFADILQKFSSHAARLGISDIKPKMPDGCSKC
ncbi:MAG: hypothetical protein J6Y19_10130 [Kiritimatiellae bacterium]|nr:hypothetical protein [Kiritimatiellia bacterium]